ncbi:hypothetical protein ASPWEDRAFT_611006 [Aspergillus wentii DTO 134E9]|uniref:Phenazine biosynthesis protein n=1 Tax=Aspergillus wentii DTO 134E9 TaxID=1073089 RepID=A0A1L9RE10_ASPWE|nr:uncharacterized protein ASPWEDRAFT_611006 [Aspergillus wentii DTO 134E9]KAI9933423.1 hypothetical protein MW887_007896 [Aspergillus wentii]OJJ33161.1 hypothetical protein ASPWEDRAFT_611006 [Aspergillus wentii DTO 134E9]
MAQQAQFVTLDVFTSQPYSGNPLAVVFLPSKDGFTANSLTQNQKQAIAREFNLSETIFVHADNGPKRTIDIFTTSCELPFAGHPTIGAASWFLSHSKGNGDENVNTLTTKSGDIPITLHAGQNAVAARIAHDTRIHAARFPARELLRLHRSLEPFIQADATFPIFSIVKGMSQIHVELPSPEALAAVTTAADGEIPSSTSGYLNKDWESGIILTYFFVRNVKDSLTGKTIIRTRGILGNLEDPATGSAASGLTSYLTLVEGKAGNYQYDVVQGVEMGRRSEIGVGVVMKEDNKIDSVELKGNAVKVSEGSILVPQE